MATLDDVLAAIAMLRLEMHQLQSSLDNKVARLHEDTADFAEALERKIDALSLQIDSSSSAEGALCNTERGNRSLVLPSSLHRCSSDRDRQSSAESSQSCPQQLSSSSKVLYQLVSSRAECDDVEDQSLALERLQVHIPQGDKIGVLRMRAAAVLYPLACPQASQRKGIPCALCTVLVWRYMRDKPQCAAAAVTRPHVSPAITQVLLSVLRRRLTPVLAAHVPPRCSSGDASQRFQPTHREQAQRSQQVPAAMVEANGSSAQADKQTVLSGAAPANGYGPCNGSTAPCGNGGGEATGDGNQSRRGSDCSYGSAAAHGFVVLSPPPLIMRLPGVAAAAAAEAAAAAAAAAAASRNTAIAPEGAALLRQQQSAGFAVPAWDHRLERGAGDGNATRAAAGIAAAGGCRAVRAEAKGCGEMAAV
ncbi:hypothetical protein JKP88DRAFT_254954 [Tribonema minus]|uniref:Uncharacterized protein n=1 Tax=Tribonema minus TaxID=303371 RepID=A0A836CH92_9STRA|nr:hypothetical protein JKP88DRAFT_254954 [Tribonema minus]